MRYDSTTGLDRDQVLGLTERIWWEMGDVARQARLGLYRQVQLVLILIRHHIPQQLAGDLFGVSQPTVSRIWRKVVPLIDRSLPDVEARLSEATLRGESVIVDGTFIPTGNCPAWGQGRANYSAYRRRQCLSIQFAVNLQGALIAVSKTVPGSRHDAKAIDLTGWNNLLLDDQWIADTAYIGKGAITPIKRTPNHERTHWEREYNHAVASLRSPVEHAIAHLKNWRILSTGYRGPLDHLPDIIRTTAKLEPHRLWNTHE